MALYGRHEQENGYDYHFIYGACKVDQLPREVRHLSQAQQQEIERLRRKYFPELMFAGYRLLNGEMIEGFFICDRDVCRYIAGYAQFYEKNDAMLAYMLDVREIARAGAWTGSHPVTDRYMPALQLPREMKAGLDAVYGAVYGWGNAWTEVNQSYRWFRLAYRWMEKPTGLAAMLAKWPGGDGMRSLAYSESYFKDEDVENTRHAEWRYAYTPERASCLSFAELRGEAERQAVRMICAARAYVEGPSENSAALRTAFGNRSYLSGLDVKDPRNWNVRSLLPAALPAGE